jgi:hydrogenase maturation protease
MKTIVLGVGNPILRDDGVGIHVVKQLKQQFQNPNVTIDEALTGGMNLLDLILGFDRAILVDAVNIKNAQPGEVRRLYPSDFSSAHSSNPHGASFLEALKLAKILGEEHIPREIIIIGIVLKENPLLFGEKLSKRINAAIPIAVQMTLNEIRKNSKIIGD